MKKEGRNGDLEKTLLSPCAMELFDAALSPSGAAGILASAGTPFLDYKRGVPVAQRPHWERVGGKRNDVKKKRK
jgi:hypothetical protein